MKKLVCDICGGELTPSDYYSSFKLKKEDKNPALAEGFGFGEERLKRFHDAFNAKYTEIRELEKGDTKDNEYAIAKQEAALKAACGKYYAPREVRYDIKIVTRDGKQHKL